MHETESSLLISEVSRPDWLPFLTLAGLAGIHLIKIKKMFTFNVLTNTFNL